LLIALPVGLLFWLFSAGNLDLSLPSLTQNDPPPVAQIDATLQRPQVARPVPPTGEIRGLAETKLQPPDDLADLYEQILPGTVSIVVGSSRSTQGGIGAGSGFILTDEGYIVTNNHVVEGGDTYIVRFVGNLDQEAQLVGVDPDSDLAILKVDRLPEGAYPLPLGDYDSVRVGDFVVAMGNPFGVGTSMSYGIVSAKGRTIPSITQFNIPQAIQTDAAINPGNSGGPLINMDGEVIGINAQIRTSGEAANSGVGFAIPVNILEVVYPSLIRTGSHPWAYLGVSSPGDIPNFLQPEEMQQAPAGAYIATVTARGPADQAGLRAGDVVVAAEDQDIRNFEDLLTFIAFRQPGDEITLTIVRDGQEQQVQLTLGERPSGNVQ